MNLNQMIGYLRADSSFMENVTTWKTIPAKDAEYLPFPETLGPRISDVLKKRGIYQLYSHQRKAIDLVNEGKDVCVVTPTASGKTLCYNLPVLSEIMRNPDARALYLFPTKALSADQVSELYDMIDSLGVDIKTFTYDGDTPASARKQIRQAGHIVVTNPDMLHSGILPHHTKWVKLFENLQYVVIDEIHVYRGVFGSNLANVLSPLANRICDWYVRLLQGTPTVVLLMILYYLVFAHSGWPAVAVAVVGFALNFGAYGSEIMRSGIESIGAGQREAALALGYSEHQAFSKYVFPQAAVHFLPVLRGEMINLLKSTSVVGYIAIQDLTKMSDIIRSRTYEAFFPLITTALIYFALAWMISLIMNAALNQIDAEKKAKRVKGGEAA